MPVQYLTNEDGQRTAIVLSLKEWKAIRKELQEYRLRKRMERIASDVKRFKGGKLGTQPLEELLMKL